MTATTHDPVDAATLAAALPQVLAAPRRDGPVRLLCFRPRHNARVFPDSLTLTRAVGVVGDCESETPWLKLPDGRPDPQTQVSLLPARVLDLVWPGRDPGVYPGDNIVADLDMTCDALPSGTLLRAGSAVLRVSAEPNPGCAKWKVRCGKDAHDWVRAPAHAAYRLRGLFCSVEQDGIVAIGDRISPI